MPQSCNLGATLCASAQLAIFEIRGLPHYMHQPEGHGVFVLGLQVAGIVLVVLAISGFTALQWRLAAQQRRAVQRAQQPQHGQLEAGRHR